MNADEKVCPRCAETIKKAALICRYCRHEFEGAPQPTPATPTGRQGDPEPSTWLPPQSDAQGQPETDTKVIRNIGLGCLGFLVLAVVIGIASSGSNSTAADNSDGTMIDTNVSDLLDPTLGNDAQPAVESTAAGWLVTSRKDEIRGGTIHDASLTSTNQVQFDFPYAGGSSLTMTVRKHPEYGEDVIFQISDGQFNCGIDDCSGMISVDGKSDTLSLVESSDNDSKTLFAAYGEGIIGNLKGSSKVIVELPFYQEGNRQFTFETKGLVWPPK